MAFCLMLACLASCQNSPLNAERNTHVFLAGDSTMAAKHPKDFPETGWGVPFSLFFDSSITLENHAKNGRSTRTFIEQGRWQAIMDKAMPGDTVIIQFGHNDESKYKTDRYTTAEQYKQNLRRMIAETRAAGADAVLMTPVVRRYFDDNEKIKATHPYAFLVRQVAVDTGVTFIDMEKVTHVFFENMGDKISALRFMHIAPGLHPNYPKGVRDNTHFNQLGAREVAQLVLLKLKSLNHPLANQLRDVDPKHMKQSY